MFRISQLLDAKRRGSSETNTESFQLPQSPISANSSAPVSPAVSIFSAKGHTRLSSSVSSLTSGSGLGISFDSPSSKGPLSGVKEEEPVTSDPYGLCEPPDLNEDYFGMSSSFKGPTFSWLTSFRSNIHSRRFTVFTGLFRQLWPLRSGRGVTSLARETKLRVCLAERYIAY